MAEMELQHDVHNALQPYTPAIYSEKDTDIQLRNQNRSCYLAVFHDSFGDRRVRVDLGWAKGITLTAPSIGSDYTIVFLISVV